METTGAMRPNCILVLEPPNVRDEWFLHVVSANGVSHDYDYRCPTARRVCCDKDDDKNATSFHSTLNAWFMMARFPIIDHCLVLLFADHVSHDLRVAWHARDAEHVVRMKWPSVPVRCWQVTEQDIGQHGMNGVEATVQRYLAYIRDT